jgi:hypothetical protein
VLICNWWYKTACGYDGDAPAAAQASPHHVHQHPDHNNNNVAEHVPGLQSEAEIAFRQADRVVQIPEFIPIAPPFDLKPIEHPALSSGTEAPAQGIG